MVEWLEAAKMEKKVILWIVIAILAIAVLYVVFFKGSGTGSVIQSSGQAATGGKLDTTGWTDNEKMNYEMHGTIPARIQQSSGSKSSAPTMVGGC